MKNSGYYMQLLGCVKGMIGIFQPSAMVDLLFYPVWQNLHRYQVIFRSLKGINAAVVGIMAASTVFLARDISLANIVDGQFAGLTQIGVIAATFVLLMFTRVPAPLIALCCLALGFIF